MAPPLNSGELSIYTVARSFQFGFRDPITVGLPMLCIASVPAFPPIVARST